MGGASSTHVSAPEHFACPKGLRSPRKHALHFPTFPSSPADAGHGSLLSVRKGKLSKVERLKQMQEEAR